MSLKFGYMITSFIFDIYLLMHQQKLYLDSIFISIPSTESTSLSISSTTARCYFRKYFLIATAKLLASN